MKDKNGRVQAVAAVNELETGQLYEEFRDAEIAAYLRRKATGRMIIIRGIYCAAKTDMRNLTQIIMTEVLSKAVENDITYAIYHPLEEGNQQRDNRRSHKAGLYGNGHGKRRPGYI